MATKAKAIRLSNSSSPNFNAVKSWDRNVLNCADLSANSNKFFIMEKQEGKGDYPYRIYTEYGRMGKPNPTREGRYYHSEYEMDSDYDSLYNEKKRKYKDIIVDDVGSSAPTQVDVKCKTKKENLSEVKDKVLKLIGKLYQNATSYLVKSIDTPLGKLSATQVAKGLEILTQIEHMLDRGTTTGMEVERLSNEFYSYIPVTFGSRVDYRRFIIDDYVKLNDRKDLLGVMSSVVQAQSTLEQNLEQKYKSLKIKLEALSSRSKEYKRLSDFVQSTKGHNHHFGFDIKEIFEVQDMVNHDRFNPYKVEEMELFHGSRNENILSIMQNGLKIKPASAVHTGSMFGGGIYFASQSTKSANYCWGFNGGVAAEENYLFVCEVATGKIKDYTYAQPHLTAAPRPYNSVRGVKSPGGLIHDEYIIYNENQVKIKYIIEFKKTR
ncbi:poly [ADP-ribose] polymerase [Paenibacillus sp. 1182]|uniref:WGR domain-containing protein n=1 Tax=Paenibacillus sp. 1182 TaxID=2806565 RepID=UPI001AE54101|nr:WGR domain-containing protein [Paenibacillus sp. 1182]MBP1309051.1 poly [ADP-ribose] polymerase [Paenibacillus sp. 1182]